MAGELFFENVETGKRYKVVSFDAKTGVMGMVGPHNREFEIAYSKESFERMGYRPVKADDAPAPPPPVAVSA